jgi:predicted oxidoreductase
MMMILVDCWQYQMVEQLVHWYHKMAFVVDLRCYRRVSVAGQHETSRVDCFHERKCHSEADFAEREWAEERSLFEVRAMGIEALKASEKN